jgi:poly-beta-1,6-N-acetyl-D-glucosamine synthase
VIGLAASALVLDGPVYRVALWVQAAFYVLAVTGTNRAIATRSTVASAAASLLVLNAAAWIAFWVWISGRTHRSWAKFDYGTASPAHESREIAPAGVGS